MSALKPGPLFAARKVAARWRNRGAGEVLSVAIQRLREAVYSSDGLIFLARPAAGDFASPPHDAGLELVEAAPSDGELYEACIGTDSARTFALRLAAGARCFLVRDASSVLHATWVTHEAAWTREVRRYFCPPPGDAYVYESFTRPEARGRGVYPFALTEICARLAAADAGLVWVGVEEENLASRKAVAKAHFEEQFRVHFGRKLGFLRVDEPEGQGVRLCLGCLAQNVKVSGAGG